MAIIWRTVDNTKKIKEALSRIFVENKLELSFRCVNTAELGSCLEFLDVEHKIENSHLGGSTLMTLLNPQLLTALFLVVNRFIQLTFSNLLSSVKQFAYGDSMKPNLIIWQV